MPVIGRLDEQVDEVLIRPLDRGRAQPDGEAPEGKAPAPDSPPAPESEREGRRAPDELPVWLL